MTGSVLARAPHQLRSRLDGDRGDHDLRARIGTGRWPAVLHTVRPRAYLIRVLTGSSKNRHWFGM